MIITNAQGTTPRMRGKDAHLVVVLLWRGNNPAYAGERAYPGTKTTVEGEQPRTRGERWIDVETPKAKLGTTPHTRGKVLRLLCRGNPFRNNPAYAGKSTHHRRSDQQCPEQPRTRGENGQNFAWPWSRTGTTPHTRGKDFTTSRFIEQLSSFLSTLVPTVLRR